jgi:hypothetical protein
MEIRTVADIRPAVEPPPLRHAERKARGKRRREAVVRTEHAGCQAPADRAGPEVLVGRGQPRWWAIRAR